VRERLWRILLWKEKERMTTTADKRLYRNHLNLIAAILFRAVDDHFTLPDMLDQNCYAVRTKRTCIATVSKQIIENDLWFNADDESWTFSYYRVCKLLDIEPERFYAKMMTMTPDEWKKSKERIHSIYGPLVS